MISALGAAYQLIWIALRSRSAYRFFTQLADALTLNFFEAYGNSHQYPDQSGDFYRCVPAFNVIAGIALGDSEFLRLDQRLFKAEPLLHAAENDVGRGIQNATKSTQMDRRQIIAEQGKDGNAIHHGRLKQESPSVGKGEGIQFLIRVHDGAFIGGDRVCAHFEGGANVIDCGLAVARAERRSFEENVGLRQTQPLPDIVWHGCTRPQLCRNAVAEKSLRIQPVFVRDPTHPPRCHSGDSPCDAALAQVVILFLQQTKQRLIRVPEAEQTEIVSADHLSPGAFRGEDAFERADDSWRPGETPVLHRLAGATTLSPWWLCARAESCRSPGFQLAADKDICRRPNTFSPACRCARRHPAR